MLKGNDTPKARYVEWMYDKHNGSVTNLVLMVIEFDSQ